jgi:hypothetical protein
VCLPNSISIYHTILKIISVFILTSENLIKQIDNASGGTHNLFGWGSKTFGPRISRNKCTSVNKLRNGNTTLCRRQYKFLIRKSASVHIQIRRVHIDREVESKPNKNRRLERPHVFNLGSTKKFIFTLGWYRTTKNIYGLYYSETDYSEHHPTVYMAQLEPSGQKKTYLPPHPPA